MNERKKLHFLIEAVIFAAVILALKVIAGIILTGIYKSADYQTISVIGTAATYIDFITYPAIAAIVLYKVIEKSEAKAGALILVAVAFSFIIRIFEAYVLVFASSYGMEILANTSNVITYTGPVIRALVTVPVLNVLGAPKKEANIFDKDMETGLWGHVMLMLFTCGIWNLIWIYRVTRYLNCVEGEEYRNPAAKLLLYMFVPFYGIYWIYKSAQRIDKLAYTANVTSDLAVVCLILEIFVPIIPPILMQDKINKIVNTGGSYVD